jgi:hypothetical protein
MCAFGVKPTVYPPLEGGSESEAIRGGVRETLTLHPSPKNSSLRYEFYRPSLKGRVDLR